MSMVIQFGSPTRKAVPSHKFLGEFDCFQRIREHTSYSVIDLDSGCRWSVYIYREVYTSLRLKTTLMFASHQPIADEAKRT
jgi:hypothetical protein